jgi:hypothetical protein
MAAIANWERLVIVACPLSLHESSVVRVVERKIAVVGRVLARSEGVLSRCPRVLFHGLLDARAIGLFTQMVGTVTHFARAGVKVEVFATSTTVVVPFHTTVGNGRYSNLLALGKIALSSAGPNITFNTEAGAKPLQVDKPTPSTAVSSVNETC